VTATPSDAGMAWTSLWAQDPPRPYLLGVAVRVVVDRLNIRWQAPSTSADVIGTVTRGKLLAASGPPVRADGYLWYRGALIESADLPALPAELVPPGDGLNGWFAAGKDAVSYVEVLDARCPRVVDLDNVAAMVGGERVTCFGGRSIELEGTYGCPACTSDIFGTFEPDWLANPNVGGQFLSATGRSDGSGMLLRFPPQVTPPAFGSIVRLRGHFDDPAAMTCAIAPDYFWDDATDPHPAPDAIAHELCRQQLVVESYDVVGADPDFGG
jgi:hypothetical protein